MPHRCHEGGPGRKRCPRTVSFLPDVVAFRPIGVPVGGLENVSLTHEELEAMRLVDLLGLDQETASSRMGVSRRSFAKDLKSGRRKVMDALAGGKLITIEGGVFTYRGAPADSTLEEGSIPTDIGTEENEQQ